MLEHLVRRLQESKQLRESGLSALWVDLAYIAFVGRSVEPIKLPAGYSGTTVRKLVRSMDTRSEHDNIYAQKHPTWLRLSREDLKFIMNCWYHDAHKWDAEWVDLWSHQLADASLPCWTREESL